MNKKEKAELCSSNSYIKFTLVEITKWHFPQFKAGNAVGFWKSLAGDVDSQ